MTSPPYRLRLILAAGIGSRFKAGPGRKQLSQVGPSGETLLEYAIFDAARAGTRQVILVIREGAEPDLAELASRVTRAGLDLQFMPQKVDDIPPSFAEPSAREKPWGTGHAVLAARAAVEGPCLVINADDFYGREAYAAAAEFASRNVGGPHLGLVAFQLGQTLGNGPVNMGICKIVGDRLVAVEEIKGIARGPDGSIRGATGPKLFDDTLVSMNFWILQAATFPALTNQFEEFLRVESNHAEAQFFLPTALTNLIANGMVDCEVLTSRGGVAWVDCQK